MHVSLKLSSALGHKDQGPNKALAQEIVDRGGGTQLKELVHFFLTKPNKELQKDCVLTIAWVADKSPELVAPYTDLLVANFKSPINRVVWGSMIALTKVAHLVPDKLYDDLPKVLDAMHSSSVVAKDHGFRILISLYVLPNYQEDVFSIILEQLHIVPSNQLGQYAEKMLVVLHPDHKNQLLEVLTERLQELSNSHHIRRLNKNILKLSRF